VLCLLDIDGTLLLGPPHAHQEALVGALADVYGVAATADDLRAVRPNGRTDQEIALLLLAAAGVDEAVARAGLRRWMARAVELYPAADAARPAPRAAPGAAAALARVAGAGVTPALLTGNLEAIAHAKMARAGLGGWFPRGRGAFGSDHERRDALVPIAEARAQEPGAVVVVGDTPRDIACARAGGARCVAVVTTHPAEALAEADAVVAGLPEAAEAVAAWAAAERDQSPRAPITRS
jgi:phosphoglycolate phosphatase-like HAD superfamily hydrolase